MKKVKQRETYCISMTVSAPIWMVEYLKATPEIRTSTIFQRAILEEKNKLENKRSYNILQKCLREEDLLYP